MSGIEDAAKEAQMADLPLWIAVGLTLTAVAWFIAAVRNRIDDMPIGSGLLRGLVIALVVGLLGAFVIPGMIHLGFPVDVGVGGFVVIALLVFGIPTAIAFFWVGALLMPLGLLFTRRESWPKVGTWVATVVVAVLLLVGYQGYVLAKTAVDAPAEETGKVYVDIEGRVLPHAIASGDATCTLFDEGTFRVDVGIGFSRTEPIYTPDGRKVTIQMVWPTTAKVSLAVSIGDRASQMGQGGELRIADGSTATRGTLVVTDILPMIGPDPDPTDPWSGLVSWTCPLG